MRLLLSLMATGNPLSVPGAHGPLEMSEELWLVLDEMRSTQSVNDFM